MTDTEVRSAADEAPTARPYSGSTASTARRYGGFYKPKLWGIGSLGLGGTIVAGVMAIVAVLLMMTPVGVLGSAALLAVTFLVLRLASHPDRYGKTWFQRRAVRISHRRRVRSGENKYLPSTLIPLGSHRLPAVLASSTLARWVTADGAEFSILRYPSRGHHVVSLRARPDGAALLDTQQVDAQVDVWGDWLASLAYEEGLVQGVVTIETSPDGGPLMQRAVRCRESARAHSLSKAWMDEVLDQYPRGSKGVSATITLTLRDPDPEHQADGRKVRRSDRQDVDELIAERLAVRLPHIMDDLAPTGAGAVDLMMADDVIEVVKSAYEPDARGIYDEARARGEDPPVSLWSSVGPSGAVAEWDHYRHGQYASVTWEFTGFTTATLTSKALLPLLEANDDVAIKRVTIIVRPVPPEQSSQIVERNHNDAEARLGDAKKPTARQRRAVRDADKARQSEADGYAVADVALLVTATVPYDQLSRAHAAVSRLAPSARLHMRLMYGQQDIGFAASIGVLGVVTESYLTLSPALINGV